MIEVMKRLAFILAIIVSCLLSTVNSAWAQGNFDPSNPPEPITPVFKYALTAVCDPDGAGSTSGKGEYSPGTQVTVRTSARAGYTFQYWTLNGEHYSDQMSFSYETVEGQMDFVAHYLFTPENPAEPYMEVKSRLYLESEPEDVCTFNLTSGAFVMAEQPLTVKVTGKDQWYEFDGWYRDGELISETMSFQYTPDYEDITLVARFHEAVFNPGNPDEPNLDRLPGDVNFDGQISIADVTALVNIILGKDNSEPYQYDHDAADVNNDNGITIADVTSLVNIILGKQN